MNIFTSEKVFLWEFKFKDAEREAFELLQADAPSPLHQAGKVGKSVLGAWSAEARTRGFFPMNQSQVPALKVKGRGAGEVI